MPHRFANSGGHIQNETIGDRSVRDVPHSGCSFLRHACHVSSRAAAGRLFF